jgi:hypothetical protein
MGVDLIEADGKAPLYDEEDPYNGNGGKATDAFPAGATSYKRISGYPITNIAEKNGVITFTFMTDNTGNEGQDGECDEYTYYFESKQNFGSGLELGDYTWDFSAENESYTGYDTNKGLQIGSGKQPAITARLTTQDANNCTVKDITVEASMASKGDGKGFFADT